MCYVAPCTWQGLNSGAKCLLYVKMLPRAQKVISSSQEHFLDNSWSLGAMRAKLISSPCSYGMFKGYL